MASRRGGWEEEEGVFGEGGVSCKPGCREEGGINGMPLEDTRRRRSWETMAS